MLTMDGDVNVAQVEKSGLITGSRLGADREYEFDELEVRILHPDRWQEPRGCSQVSRQ